MGRRSNRRWNSCLAWFVTSVGALCWTISCIGATHDAGESWKPVEVPVHSACSTAAEDAPNSMKNRYLMFVSTLDGKISALDVKEEGKLLWSVQADARPLLSSSISKLEIMHEGVPTRYIPSLDGGLYRYDGESIEAVPMTAETLISSSFKMADDTVMTGGKDLLSYGLDPDNGQMRYACSVSGCKFFGENVKTEEDILVVSRNTQTVRAVDSRTGSEKWNFSVGQHEVKFLAGEKQVITNKAEGDEDVSIVTCPNQDEDSNSDTDGFLKILVPQGMVVGLDQTDMQTVKWQHKFGSPVSNAWLLRNGELVSVSMFDNRLIPALSSFEPPEPPEGASLPTQPLLYVGMHQSQLYVQPSQEMQQQVYQSTSICGADGPTAVGSAKIPRVAWKPYLNTAEVGLRDPSLLSLVVFVTLVHDSCTFSNFVPIRAQFRTPILGGHKRDLHLIGQRKDYDDGTCTDGEDTSALTVWHENYPFDNGYYLYPEYTLPVHLPDNISNQESDSMLDVIPASLWNWWKEVVAISILTSVVVHIILTKMAVHNKILILPDTVQNASNGSSSHGSGSSGNLVESDSSPFLQPIRQNSNEYVSRYTTDFEHIQCLGKGGFGIVFESKNKVDDCCYAVKRIELPNSEGAKEKVMREVKALAKLDHIGIVRFFHAWLESPPPGWQEDKDKELEDSECLSTPTPCNTVSQAGSRSAVRKVKSPMALLQNPFGGMLDVDVSMSKAGGSSEFSCHDEDDFADSEEESGSFSIGVGTPKMPSILDKWDDSLEVEFRLSDTEFDESQNCVQRPSNNHIPFSHQRSLSDCSKGFDNTNSSCQIVFEDSGCGDKSSKSSNGDYVCIGMQSSQSGGPKFSHDSSDQSESPVSSGQRSRTKSKSRSRTPSDKESKITIESDVAIVSHGNEIKRDSLPGPKLFLFIQMQLCKRETLKDWMIANTLNRDRHLVLDIFDQIVSAVEYVHDCGLMHRDLKPTNIFFSLDGVIKVGDFGLVTALAEEQNEVEQDNNNEFRKHTAQVGTKLYMSPEQTSGKVYSHKVDIFSLGMILFELLYPFTTAMERVSTLIGVKQHRFPERFIREMPKEHKFVSWLLAEKPEDRPSAKQILNCELLRQFEARRMPRTFRTRTVSNNSNGSTT